MIKVLIVDDEYIMRQGLRYMINWEEEGYTIVGEATNGKDALALTEELQPHIIISDIVMPVLDGVDFSDAIHKMYPNMQLIILSGYDKFEYVKHTLMNGVVDYILKPTLNPQELKKVLEKASVRIPGFKLWKKDGAVSYERDMERFILGLDKELNLEEFHTYFKSSYYSIYAVNIHKENRNGQDMTELLSKKVERCLKELVDIEHMLLMIREEQICIIFGYELSGKSYMRSFVEGMNNQLAILCEGIFGLLSHSYTDLAASSAIYQQDIVPYVDKGFYYGGDNLLLLEGMAARGEQPVINKFDFFRYNRLLSSRQFGDAKELLITYHKDVIQKQMDVYRMKNQMKNMIYNFLDFLSIDENEKEKCRYEFFKVIEQTKQVEEYDKAVHTVLAQLLNYTDQRPTINDERMERMLKYIEQNFQEDFKLEDLSSEFNFNYHYLSAYFNQQMKEGFSEYLNRIRIDKACQMLKEGKLSIAQISGEVGYSEHSYFCRVFKKITGKTPSVWRRE